MDRLYKCYKRSKEVVPPRRDTISVEVKEEWEDEGERSSTKRKWRRKCGRKSRRRKKKEESGKGGRKKCNKEKQITEIFRKTKVK